MKRHLPLYGLVRENIRLEHGVQQTVESLGSLDSGRSEWKSVSCETVFSATLQVSNATRPAREETAAHATQRIARWADETKEKVATRPTQIIPSTQDSFQCHK
jgi:hypothetical protein